MPAESVRFCGLCFPLVCGQAFSTHVKRSWTIRCNQSEYCSLLMSVHASQACACVPMEYNGANNIELKSSNIQSGFSERKQS